MKTKYGIIIFFLGFLINVVAVFLKVTHWSFGPVTGNVVLTIGSIFQVLGVFLLFYKLVSSAKFKEFLNW